MSDEATVKLKLPDGTHIVFSRSENKEVSVCHNDHCVILPRGTGQQTLDLFALLEKFGAIEENDDESV